MACQIDGCTLHHWSGIPVGETDDTALTKDAHKLATKRQSLRCVLIGEVSMISAQLVGVLDILIGKVAWKRDSWKRRAEGTERPFGGLNVMFFGDFSQLTPVSGTTFASSPELAVGSIATHGNNGVWETSRRRWQNKKIGLAASWIRSIAKTQCSGGLQCALDRQNWWFLGLQEVLDRLR